VDDSTSPPLARRSPVPLGASSSSAPEGSAAAGSEGKRAQGELLSGSGAQGPPPEQRRRAPRAGWPPWTALAALVSGIVLAAVGSLLVDIPAVIFGVRISTAHVPGGVEIADTAVQDVGFVLVALFFAHLGGRRVEAWQFGLRPTPLWRAVRLIALTLIGFWIFSILWGAALNTGKEKLLEQLGAGESTALLLLSAGLTCVVAPICEEFLFRGYIFTALRNWRGVWPAAVITGLLFGGVHVGSAPAVDLIPLAGLGFVLCLLYRATGSLYPCIVVHSLNNSIAFGGLEYWSWEGVIALMVCALGVIWLIAQALKRVGVITPEPVGAEADGLEPVGVRG
jgi:membrane protease YdiL (CAAX protease family)